MQQALDHLTQNPIFKTIVDNYGLPTIPVRPQGFATLVLLILEQQVSINSAKATFDKIKKQFPEFMPEQFADLVVEDFRKWGVSRQKARYISGLAAAIIKQQIDLESLSKKSAEQVRVELIAINGIGNWTIDVYLMFCLQSQDVMPLGDIAVVNTIKELFDVHTKQEMEQLSITWAPYRSVATYLLWHHYLKKRKRTISYAL